jgi:hypothetical protein
MPYFNSQKETGSMPKSVFEDPMPAAPSVFPTAEKVVKTSKNAAANRALEEQYFNGGEQDFQERFDFYERDGLVMDAVMERILELDSESKISSIVNNDELSLDTKVESIRWAMNLLPYQRLTPYDDLLFQAMRVEGGASMPVDIVNQHYSELPMSTVIELGKITRERQLAKGNQRVNEVAAAHGWSNFGDMAAEVAVQDFIPIWNVATRLGLGNMMADVADVELSFTERLLPGSIRARMREHLVSLEPDEYERTIREIGEALMEAQAHPVLGPIITDYNAMEFWTAVFNDEVMKQGNPQDNIDLWLGNAELGFEALFGAMILGKVGGKAVVRAAFQAADGVKARQVAGTMRNSEQTQALTEMLQEEAIAAKFEVEASSEPLLPKPAPLADDIEYLPDGSRPTIEWARSEAIRVASTRPNFLSSKEMFNAIEEELKILDEAAGAATYTRMSTIEILDNNEGFRIKAIFGETPNKGFDSFEDAAIEALELDPELRHLEIVRIGDSGTLEPVQFTPKQLEELTLGEGTVPSTRVGELIGDEYFLRYTQERAFHPFDKQHFGSGTISQSLFRWAFTPNAKFSSDFYNQFASATFDEERAVTLLQTLGKTYSALGIADKRVVDNVFEWAEEYGKNFNRAPHIHEIRGSLEVTDKQLAGYESLRITYDTMYEMLNRRQYREWLGAGFKTARPFDNSMATYHGKPLQVGDDGLTPGTFLDPVTGQEVRLDANQIQELYVNGGTVLKLDVPVATVNERTKVTRVLLDPEAYRVGNLSSNPLKYHPGYHFRFYDDPYYVVKIEKNATLDGKQAKKGDILPTAIRTAGSHYEAQKFVARATKAVNNRYGEANAPTFQTVRARNLEQAESSLLQKEVFQREGRLFYDDRNFDALPSVTGNRAHLQDQSIALEMGIRGVAREVTGKDSLRIAKKAFDEEYGRKLNLDQLHKGKPLQQIEADLRQRLRNTAVPDEKKNLSDALQYIRYFRLIEGTNNPITPMVRKGLLHFAESAEAYFKGKGHPVWKGFQKWAQTTDPLKTARSVAFTLFMRMRPIRQYIMQSAQPMFLMGVDPAYIASGRWAVDSQIMQLSVAALRGAGDLPISIPKRAAAMGLTQKEFRQLIKQFERSGLVDIVDAHDMTGGQIRLTSDRAVATPNPGNPADLALYGSKKAANAVMDTLGTGFTKGETNNITVSYMVGLRKYMKENNVDSLLKLNEQDWLNIRIDSSNLALAMIRPNSMAYQTGLLSLATQFLSFQHKSAMALMGLNPAITRTQAAKIWAANTAMYGADFTGYGFFVSTVLRDSGLEWTENEVIPGTDSTVRDVLAEGLFENVMNAIGESTIADWQDLDLSFLAPGPDLEQHYRDLTEISLQTAGEAMFGPAGSIYGDITQQLSYAQKAGKGLTDRTAIEKVQEIGRAVLEGFIPQLTDFQKARLMRQYDRYFTSAGEPIDLVPTRNAVYARLIGGIQTNAEVAYYHQQRIGYGPAAEFNNLVKITSSQINRHLLLHYNNELTTESMNSILSIVIGMWDDEIPEGRRNEFRQRVFNSIGEDGTSLMDKLVTKMKQGSLNPEMLTALEKMRNIRGARPGDVDQLIEMYQDLLQRRIPQELEMRETLEQRVERSN